LSDNYILFLLNILKLRNTNLGIKKEVIMAEVYEKLRERLDMFPQGFPKTQSGVEMEILEKLFSVEEAEIALSLKPYPEPIAMLAERIGRDELKLGKILFDMSKRGLILRYKESEEVIYYFLSPWMVGIWEFQLNNLNKENIPLYEKFYQEGIVASATDRSVGGFRVIPVEQEIKDDKEIQPYEQVSAIIEANTKFAVADCVCRKESGIMGEDCDKLLEACMSFGFAADYYIDNGLAREISKDEAKEILLKAEEDGLVHCSSNHMGDKIFICNCCGCHCKALALITKHNNPGLIAQSNYYASVDTDTCEGCETCTDRCQVDAIEMIDEIAAVTLESCIGCGLCVSTCPTGSISMVHKQPDALSHIFTDDNDLMQARAKDTGKAFPFE
jgi:electron transport complex protein RnfB